MVVFFKQDKLSSRSVATRISSSRSLLMGRNERLFTDTSSAHVVSGRGQRDRATATGIDFLLLYVSIYLHSCVRSRSACRRFWAFANNSD